MTGKPIIGVTVAHYSEELRTFPREYYVERVRQAGGIPVLIPPIVSKEEAAELLAFCTGLLLTGGGDISPIYLREQPRSGLGECQPERDQSELFLTELALELDKPVLGICRGVQVLAIAAGGRLYQDIRTEYPTALEHRQTAPRQHAWHEVEVVESKLYQLLGEPRLMVNSLHHQAVAELPPGFIVSATAPDGIIEGLEKQDAEFVIGVQWHPESMKGDNHSEKLFRGFVRACRG